MKIAKTVIDDQDRARKAAVMGGVVASNKALDVALKQVKVLAPETPAIFFRRRHWLQPGICQWPSVWVQGLDMEARWDKNQGISSNYFLLVFYVSGPC